MANQAQLAEEVDQLASFMEEVSVFPLDDKGTADFLIKLVCDLGDKLDLVQVPLLLSIAAQARLRARRVTRESEVVS